MEDRTSPLSSTWLLAGSGLTSHKLPVWWSPFAMMHPPNTVTGTWIRLVWVAGTARLVSPLEGREGGAGGCVSG